MKIALVGADERAWKTEEQKEKAKATIRCIFVRAALGKGLTMEELESKLDKQITSFDYSNIVLVTGHCHELGVDIWAEEIADELGIKKEIYPAEVHQWEDFLDKEAADQRLVKQPLKGYKSRNIQIAEACDVLYDIEPKGSCRHCGGKGKKVFEHADGSWTWKVCRYCKGTGIYSGGTWTMRYAEKLGKEAYQIVIE